MEEIWKDIKGYEGLYMVSSLGRIKSLERTIIRGNGHPQTFKERILKPIITSSGYLYVSLSKNGKQQREYVHRLVAMHFLPNPDNKPCVDHINTNKQLNTVNNLLWVTYQENTDNPISKKKHKENVYKSMLGKFGKDHPNSKPIIQLDINGAFIKEWSCAAEVQRELGYKKGFVGDCCKDKYRTAYGYKWGYVEDYERIPFKVFDLEMYKKKVG